jgi:hypothetical protein
MKFLKSFQLFERGFSKDYFDKHPDFYLSKAKKLIDLKKKFYQILSEMDMNTIKFKPTGTAHFKVVFPDSTYMQLLEVWEALTEADVKGMHIPDRIQLTGYIPYILDGNDICSFPEKIKTDMLISFMLQTGQMLELSDEEIDYIEKQHDTAFMFLHTQYESYTFPASSFEKHKDVVQSKVNGSKVRMSKNLEAMIGVDHRTFDRDSNTSTLEKAKEMLRKLQVEDIKVSFFNGSKYNNGEVYHVYAVQVPNDVREFINYNLRNKKFEIHFTIDVEQFNRVHTSLSGISKEFRGLGLGLKQYKALVDHVGWIRTDNDASVLNSQNIWLYLSTDTAYHVFRTIGTDNDTVVAMKKDLPISEIKEIIQKIKTNFKAEIELDETLEELLGK